MATGWVRPVGDDWAGAIDGWVLALRVAGRAETTIGTRRDHVQRLSRAMTCGPWEVTGDDLLAWAGAQTWARETRRSMRASLRSFYGWAFAAGLVDVDPSLSLPVVAPGAPRPRPAPEAAYRAALAATDERGRLILRLAAEAGLRRAEVATVHSRDLLEDLLGWSLLVHGKGGKDRVVPLSVPLALQLRARGPGWAFPGDDHGHLSPRWVGKIGTRALPEGWTLHTLRHRFATRAYAAERDLLAVQTLLGHTSPVTTQRYVAVPADRLRAAMLAAS